jgi:predicted PurR-regulated permease PerM
MDDAADRVSRYLRMQVFVNVCYGTCIGIGLYFIGVPNALLWGALGTVLRFIPYVGVWIATLLPALLAIAVSPHWMMPLLTLAVCGGVEVVISNAVEPLLYGKQTGVSVDRVNHGGRFLDLALGTARPHHGHAADSMPRGDGQARPAPVIS